MSNKKMPVSQEGLSVLFLKKYGITPACTVCAKRKVMSCSPNSGICDLFVPIVFTNIKKGKKNS